jgi:hypothetical protein
MPFRFRSNNTIVAHTFSNDRLNELLIGLGRSLLQYVGESWPWTPGDDVEEKSVIDRLVAQQRESVAHLAALLDERGHLIDPGAYPTDYTSLHYVALDYLLGRLVAQQQELAGDARTALQDSQGDEEVEMLLTGVATQAEQHREELSKLVAARNGATNWSVQDKLGPAPNPV